MGESVVHVLVVDDFPSWRRFVASILEEQPRFRIVGEASDGLEAAQKAQELQPDIIMLDISLPRLNGIEAARRIRELSPKAKIVFLSENRSWDIVEEALGTGAGAYVVKSDVVAELLPAVEAVLTGKLFVSASLAGDDLTDPKNEPAAEPTSRRIVLPFPPQNVRAARRHEVGFYSHDRNLIDDVTQFVGAALRLGNGAIVVATESHRSSLLSRLQAYGIDMGAAVEEGRYIAWDAAGALSAFMLDGMPDPIRFLKLLGHLISTAAEAAKAGQSRVALFGECVQLLWMQGKTEAAIQMEKLGNQLTKAYDIDILCGYSSSGAQDAMDEHTMRQICEEHSAVHSR